MRWLKMILIVILGLVALWLVGRMIWSVPSTEGRPTEHVIPFDPETRLGPEALAAQSDHPGQSGVNPLPDGRTAFLSRMALAGGAERSIDVMYYIWHDDETGLLLMNALKEAAARGVRVRLLLDDNGIAGMDDMLAAMHAQENFSVRLFNPSTVRNPKLLGYALYPLRMNRRMHNKAFIVDGAAAIVGGRNIGNEYFEVGEAPAYLDLDVLGVGSVVTDTAAIFDEYWNSAPVLALDQVISGSGDMAAFDNAVEAARNSDVGQAISDMTATVAAELARGERPPLVWTDVSVVADDPLKGVGEVDRDKLMIFRLADILGDVQKRLDLISAYFVPGKNGSQQFAALASKGVEVNILTNSWQATDVPMVHAGYVKYRRELLEAGVNLYELKPAEDGDQPHDPMGPFGSSGASLHAKTFAADDLRVFIGSFNFDPRSAALNCEMGFLIESAEIATGGSDLMNNDLVGRSYQPILRDGKMLWRDPQADGGEALIEHEPGLGLGNRVAVYVLNLLPIEWLL
ncbi:phospholipase D family protein [Paracoccus albus]|uniref:phospholipase D family protein n=1 Tax=Paracoccus albus TaxID=3017784 RepID=UPI0022F0F4DB|nr:phospholipase D family protein [Paracoccus albus]WBU60358.1 phospholipase D family protein [Paracoccus albus]